MVEYVYDSWGKLISTTGSMANTLGIHNPFRYRGYYYDAETGFYYLNSRYYDPETGRFLNADGEIAGAGQLQGCNLYAYCFNNPINMTDENGNWPNWGTLFKGVVTIGVGILAVSAVVATGGAATPLVALGLAAVGTAGTASIVMGSYDVVESFSGQNSLKSSVGASNYETAEMIAAGVASAGTAWIGQSLPSGGNPKPYISKGSTGRTAPANLKEQLAMKEVRSNPLFNAKALPLKMTDSRWPASEGWTKMSKNVNGIEIHFLFNENIRIFDDFKFK